MKHPIKVSIITPSFNSEKTIEKSILSVLAQNYTNIEYIIIDGGSTDRTIDIIKKYQDKIHYWVSERDRGISDAFNKGLAAASGRYINFQGADDYLLSNDVVSTIMEGVDPEKDMLVCGRVERIEDTPEKKVAWSTSAQVPATQSLLFRMTLPHQALFTHEKFFKTYGVFDVNNKFCMDYELLLRAYRTFPQVIMRDVFVSAWRAGGIGTDRTLEVLREYYEIKKKHFVAPVWFLYLIYQWSKLKYYIKKTLT